MGLIGDPSGSACRTLLQHAEYNGTGVVSQTGSCFHGTLSFLERTTDRQITIIQACVLSRHFLKNERSALVTSRKQLTILIVIILINFEFSNENEDFVTLASATVSLPVAQHARTSLMRLMVILTNVTS